MITHEANERQRGWEMLIDQVPVLKSFKLALKRSRPPRSAATFFANWKTWRKVLAGLIDSRPDLDRTARAMGWLTLDSAKPMAARRKAA